VFYTLCTLAWIVAPGTFLTLLDNLFHGLELSSLAQPRPFAWSGFALPLLVLSAWALGAGAFYAWLSNRLAR
jgi:hypothetical protein